MMLFVLALQTSMPAPGATYTSPSIFSRCCMFPLYINSKEPPETMRFLLMFTVFATMVPYMPVQVIASHASASDPLQIRSPLIVTCGMLGRIMLDPLNGVMITVPYSLAFDGRI